MTDADRTIFKRLIPMLIIGLFVAFALGVAVGSRPSSPVTPSVPPAGLTGTDLKPQNLDVSLLWDVWRLVEDRYVDRKELDRKKLLYGAAEGLVRALGDPYSAFFDPPEARQFADDVKGKFEGIGAEIGIKDGVLRIIAPLEGSPAQKAGIMAGDAVLKIDDAATADLSLEQAVQKIRGPRGTTVKLTIAREGDKEPRVVTIRRDVINVPNVKWRLIDPDVAYVQIFRFTENADVDFRRIAAEVQSARAKRLILDVRSNPGGYLEVAQSIAGQFLERGALVVTEDFGNGRDKQEYRSEGPSRLKDLLAIILVNEGSASASEILAGALRDARGIQLVGMKTFGKGSVQQLENLRDGASLKITVAKWLTPKGHNISKEGLQPDIVVERTADDVAAGRDPQLDKAVEVVRGL